MKFTPAADNLTTASLGLGSGVGKSATIRASGPPVCFTWMAFMGELDSGLVEEVSGLSRLIFVARGGRNCAPEASDGCGFGESFLSPLWGCLISRSPPMACVLGCNLSPLCGCTAGLMRAVLPCGYALMRSVAALLHFVVLPRGGFHGRNEAAELCQ